MRNWIKFVALDAFTDAAVLDLNGDGKLEVIVHSSHYEGHVDDHLSLRAGQARGSALGQVRSLRDRRLADVDGLDAVTPCRANSLCKIREFF